MKTWPVVGHQWAVQGLRHAVARDEIPHALLITGPASVGKHTLAQQLVAAMLCQADNDKPCGTCLACRKLRSGNHPDYMVVEPEGSTARLKIDQIRPVERFLALTPKEGARKVVLISDFERATIGAANALLKTLEEPPFYAHLILLATDADLLLPTIVSRSQQIGLRPLPSRLVAEALVSEWLVEPGLAERLARISGGRVGWAVRAATHAMSGCSPRWNCWLRFWDRICRQGLRRPRRWRVRAMLCPRCWSTGSRSGATCCFCTRRMTQR